jgi:ABC-2 type transport system ATP-binding protein
VFLDFIQDDPTRSCFPSHITSDLEKICDYITFLHRGQVVFSEEKDALLGTTAAQRFEEELRRLDPAAIKGCRKSQFGWRRWPTGACCPQG